MVGLFHSLLLKEIKMKKVLLFFLMIFSTSSLVPGDIILYDPLPTDPNASYGSQFDSVVGLFGHYYGDPNSYWHASAVVIENSHSLLFSAHQADNMAAYDFFSVRTGRNLASDVDGIFYSYNRPVIHSTWNGVIGQGRDLAFLAFDDPIMGVNPAQLYDGEDELGMLYSRIGFGRTGNVHNGSPFYDYQKRGTMNYLSGHGVSYWTQPEHERWYLTTQFRNSNHPDFHELGGMGQPGGSGGGWFINIGDQYFLSGIHSTDDGFIGFNSRSFASTVDFAWAHGLASSAVPEPSSLLLTFLLFLFPAFRRNRKVVFVQ